MFYKALPGPWLSLTSLPLFPYVNMAVMICCYPSHTTGTVPSQGLCSCSSLCLPQSSSTHHPPVELCYIFKTFHGWFPPFTQICFKRSSLQTSLTFLSKIAPMLVSFSSAAVFFYNTYNHLILYYARIHLRVYFPSPSLECKLLESKEFCPSGSLLYPLVTRKVSGKEERF